MDVAINLFEYTAKTKLSGVLVDNRLLWREHIGRAQKALGKQLRVLRKISYLKSHLLEEIYFKTVIPRVTYSIGVWGSCSVAMFDMENVRIKVV